MLCQELWQNCHFRHICQICHFHQLLWAPFTALCFPSLTIVAKLSFSPYLPNSLLSPTFMGPLHCFLFFLVGEFVAKLSFSPYLPNSPLSPTFMGPLRCFVLCLVGVCAKLSFSPFLANSPLSSTFMGPLHCFMFFLVGDCGKIVIFAIFAKIRHYFLFFAIFFVAVCISLWGLLNRRQHASKTTVKLGGQRHWKNKRKKTWMTALQRLPGTQQGGLLKFSPSGRYQGTTKKGIMKCIC